MSQNLRQATKIMLIRHAEKPKGSNPPFGVTAEGEREKESLTVRGWQRAGALAALFAPVEGRFPDPALARPQFLYASKFVKHGGSRRSIETITPLAEKLALRINSNFVREETGPLLEQVFMCSGVVLIAWQQELIPEIASLILGDQTTAPHDWPDDRFDMIWVFDREADADRYTFTQVPQTLLMGDWSTPII
jgi:hypothetical protein